MNNLWETSKTSQKSSKIVEKSSKIIEKHRKTGFKALEEGVLVNEWSPLGSMTNYDGSATAFTRCRLPSTALADIASQAGR